jgi:2-desacetyl-2-hydroxyethyl bacteriochlorophyllide A dehydrogenase
MKYRACVYTGNGRLESAWKEIPPLREHDVLIRIDAATICGTDVHILEGKFESKPPLVLGHEFAGFVEAVGPAVTNVGVGELVSVEPHLYCGICKYCRIGKEHMCSDRTAFGVHADGGFAQYCVVPDRNVYRVPEGVSPVVAALAENIGCCLHGIERAGVKQGDHVAVLGGGFVGIVMAEFARMSGAAQVTVVEPNAKRRLMAEARGFRTVNPLEEDAVRAVRESSYGLGADVAIECAGRAETAGMAIRMADRCGTVVFFGVVPPGQTIEIEPNEIYGKELTIVGSVRNPYNHYRSIEKLQGLRLEELVTHHFGLDQMEEAFEAVKQGAGFKVAIRPNHSADELAGSR